MSAKSLKKDITYKSYLDLPSILNAQKRISGSHDEMLFIVVHQAYELWFKLVLFELDRVQAVFAQKTVADKDLRVVAAGLERIIEVMGLLVRQIDVLQTMTPLDFLDFRHVFRSASGFQSLQFRALEIRLGLKPESRVGYDGKSYASFLSAEDRKAVEKLEKQPSLFEQLDKWLCRTPFVEAGGFDFWKAYRKAVTDMLDGDRKRAADDIEIRKIDNTRKQFDMLFDEKGEGKMSWRLSLKAVQAALFINLYRDQPALQVPFKILSCLMDIDESLTIWRFRHALMVQRMLGMKMGSGGSTGHDYLAETTSKHRIFLDLYGLSTFLIPRSALPVLPKNIEERMGFKYWDAA